NMIYFLFSSRRRHTSFSRDWSSDVCSSDLCLTKHMTCSMHPTGLPSGRTDRRSLRGWSALNPTRGATISGCFLRITIKNGPRKPFISPSGMHLKIRTMGFFYDRSKPKKKEQSYGKLAVQQRMRLAMAFLNPLRPILAESWMGAGKGSNSKAFGQALRDLLRSAVEGQYPDQRIAPERVAVSMGILPGIDIGDVVRQPQALEVYFTSENNPMARPDDQVVVVVYSPEAGIGGRNTEPSTRKEGHIKVELPPQFWDGPF